MVGSPFCLLMKNSLNSFLGKWFLISIKPWTLSKNLNWTVAAFFLYVYESSTLSINAIFQFSLIKKKKKENLYLLLFNFNYTHFSNYIHRRNNII